MGRGAFRKRIIEMGFIRGKEVDVIQNAPLKDPIHYRVMGYDVSLRRNDAQMIEVVSVAEFIEASTGKPENRHTGMTEHRNTGTDGDRYTKNRNTKKPRPA